MMDKHTHSGDPAFYGLLCGSQYIGGSYVKFCPVRHD